MNNTKKVSNIVEKRICIGLIGCGSFAKMMHVPHLLKDNRVLIKGVCTSSKKTAKKCQNLLQCEYSTTNYKDLLNDKDIEAIFIYTRHNTHAKFAMGALNASKFVYSEKPISLTSENAEKVINSARIRNLKYIVGYNRRFSPLVNFSNSILQNNKNPKSICYRISTDFISGSHWLYDMKVGGGKIIGEACHFFDTCNFLINSPPKKIMAIGKNMLHSKKKMIDSIIIDIEYEDSSTATIIFNELSGPKMEKERIEIFSSDHYIEIKDFKSIKIKHYKENFTEYFESNQDKGHQNELKNVISYFLNENTIVPSIEECILPMKMAIEANNSIRLNSAVDLL